MKAYTRIHWAESVATPYTDQFIYRLTQIDTGWLTLVPMGNLQCPVHLNHSYSYFKVSSPPNLHVSGLWEDIGDSQESPNVKGWGLIAIKIIPMNSKELPFEYKVYTIRYTGLWCTVYTLIWWSDFCSAPSVYFCLRLCCPTIPI